MFTIHAEMDQIQSFCPQVIYIRFFFHIRSGSLVCDLYPISLAMLLLSGPIGIQVSFFLVAYLSLRRLSSSVSIHTSLSSRNKHGQGSNNNVDRKMRKCKDHFRILVVQYFLENFAHCFLSSVLDLHTHTCYHHL